MSTIKTFLTAYFNHVHEIHASGRATDERSYYPALADLFNSLGATLNPRVIAVPDVKDRGVGHPDFLLEVETTHDTRAAVEVKGTAPELDTIIQSEQVRRYLTHHDPTMVTNLRDFALVRMGKNKTPEVIMRHTFAPDEATFWFAPKTAMVNEHAARFGDFLLSALTWDAQINRPGDLAEALARYAREALRRLEDQPAAAIDPLRKALSEALGLQFTGAEGEHFFRSSLVQTLFYGLFSAWVACNRLGECADFRWREAGDYLGLPLVRELFEKIAVPSQLESFDIRKPLEWAEATLNRTVWEEFSKTFQQGDAINYFYEPFLEAYDPDLRRDLGVWYTPPEIVRYMVARVDTVLREELGLDDGLASPNVVILDPCCGTGAYLVETLRHIAATLKDKGGDALIAADLKTAATGRVFGFEILPAPFIVAQLQIGTLLADLGAPLKGEDRAGVYLTNALTGWDKSPKQLSLAGFPALQHEAEESAHVKQEAPIIVILGNPPYSGFAGTDMKEEHSLMEAYRKTKRAPAPHGQGLNDLYVRFYRMAERRIVERTGQGVVCFISNYSWLDGLSHTGMRERYLEAFDKIWIDNLNGDKYRTGKLTPDGKPDPSVFSTEHNREGIQVGTAIATLARCEGHQGVDAIQYRSLWGTTKRAQLSEAATYETLKPHIEVGLPFMTALVSADYLLWPLLPDLFPLSFPGIQPSRDDVVVDISRDRLVDRMLKYFDPEVSNEQLAQIMPGAMQSTLRFQAGAVREYLLRRGFLPKYVVPYCYRPFDMRWLYWEPETKLLDEKRAEYFLQVHEANIWITATQQNRKDFDPPLTLNRHGSRHIIERGANLFPLIVQRADQLHYDDQAVVYDWETHRFYNLSDAAIEYLLKFQRENKAANQRNPEIPYDVLFFHAVAIMHSPAYRTENAGALRQDWPRIPLPASRDRLIASAELGRQVAALLDSECPVKGVTEGKLRDELKSVGVITRVGGGQLNPDTDLAITAGWGHAGQSGVTMPGKGKLVQRTVTADEFAGLGDQTVDVYLNDVAYWRNMPLRVWEYTIGGYQVIKKWLSYREHKLLGRPLTSDEVRDVTNIARRIAAILLLEPDLDANYEAVKAATVNWADLRGPAS